MTTSVLTVVGARPQFVKAAVLCRAFTQHADVHHVLVHTGQHHDEELSGRFFDELQIPLPAHNLGIHGGSHADMTARMLLALEPVLVAEAPAVVVVLGDTNSTLAAALVAAKLELPVAHVEAGLRSFDRRMPEELNRIVTDRLSQLLFAPTTVSVANLEREGITDGVHLVGDVMFDAALHAQVAPRPSPLLARLGLDAGFVLATVHRAENTDDGERLARVVAFIREVAGERPVILPIHPRTAAALRRERIATEGIHVVDPVGYQEMAILLRTADLVLTDSGGLQKEAYFHRTPCITLRASTEWTETIDAGWNRLWIDPPSDRPRRDIDEYGDGTAGERIASLLLARFGGQQLAGRTELGEVGERR